jgi:predicted MPP superfamily phosphohydrolase
MRISRRRLPSSLIGRTLVQLSDIHVGPRWIHPEIADRIAAIAEAGGIRMLRNAVADVEGLQVVGLDDLWARRFDSATPLASLDRARAMMALSHNPDTVDLDAWRGFEGWILAGHTLGGQCKPPFLPPPIVPVRNRRYTAGVFDLPGGRTLYVNRGVGHLFQVRFNVRPEVTVFTLQRA